MKEENQTKIVLTFTVFFLTVSCATFHSKPISPAQTAFGLLPLAVGSGAAGREIEGAMAIVILGGIVTSTTLNLLVLPTLALKYGRLGKKEQAL
jgi:Cu/Ag efflux pump CusA